MARRAVQPAASSGEASRFEPRTSRVESLTSPVGLIAGNGLFPIDFAKSARERGLDVVAVAHRGETDPALEQLVQRCVWIRVGQVGKILKTLRGAGCRHAAFAGGISRVKIFGGVRLDWRGAGVVARLRSFKDDAVLRALAEEVEKEGIEVIPANLLLTRSVPVEGTLTRRGLEPRERADAKVGWEAARISGSLDIGQTVVVKDGVIVSIEAVEGTDAAIRRAGGLAGAGSVVVKLAKPHQDLRLDLPAVGVHTLASMQAAGAKALVLEAGRAVMLDPDEFIRQADAAGIAVIALTSAESLE